MLAEKYSLLIPTFDRPDLLEALLGYLARKGASFPVLVLDSSNDRNKQKNEAIANRDDLDVRLMQFDASARFDFKIGRALKEINSDYVSLCADDDVVFIDAIELSLKELDTDNQLAACHGVYLNISPNHSEITLRLEYASPSIDADDAIGRTCQLLTQYEALNYAVHRRAVMVDIIETLSEARLPISMFWELFYCLMLVVSGKVKRLPHVYYLRRAHDRPGRENFHPATWIAEDPDFFLKAFLEYRERLFAYCETHVPQFGLEAKKRLTQAHVIYLCRALQDGSAIKHALAGTPSPLGGMALDLGREPITGPISRSLIVSLLSPAASLVRRLRRRPPGTEMVSFRGLGDDALTFKAPRNVKALLSSEMIADLSRFGRA